MLFLNKKLNLLIFIIILFTLFVPILLRAKKEREFALDEGKTKYLAIFEEGLELSVVTNADTIKSLLEEQKIEIGENDYIFPSEETKIYSGSRITIWRGKKVLIQADGNKVNAVTQLKTVEDALDENNVNLGEDDITAPPRLSMIENGAQIKVTRVKIEEQIVKKDIPFEIKSTEDDKLSWRTKKISQPGQKGIREIKYKVVSHNGKEISRKILEEHITKEPVEEISVQGTYMKLGKANKGQGTWYAWKGGLFAASTTIPKGAFAKVTNVENGKTVVVQINDYGPQGKGRIIDLDKVAFAEIASLGAGVIGVKVEQVLN